MPEFENPNLNLPAVEGEMAPAPPPNLPTPRDLNPENYGEELYDPDMIPLEGNMDTILEEPEEQGEIQDLREQFENIRLLGTETPEVEQTIGDSYANQQGEITDSANILEDAEVPSEFGDKPIVGKSVGNQYGQQQEPSNAPEGVEFEEQTIPDERERERLLIPVKKNKNIYLWILFMLLYLSLVVSHYG